MCDNLALLPDRRDALSVLRPDRRATGDVTEWPKVLPC